MVNDAAFTQPSIEIHYFSLPTLTALAEGDLAEAEELSGLTLGEYFVSPTMRQVWKRRTVQVTADPSVQEWVTGAVIADGIPVGRAGYHGPPEDGLLEAGYEIDPAHRRRGYARSALSTLIDRARREPDVSILRLCIRPDNAASLAVIRPFDFHRNGEQIDPDDGLEHIYELDVSR
ncbi:GNAT family N-acetyltransferase [Acaricomes phytoseiuli]|uniref:GNAT family N-acetyltransferase n=1 Tax=Acaricomes phytoseiuli TaxID=291968 RepID=UPI001FE18C1B|nr:GNAT family protein [Acaricomes phytoseiuli]MCW1249018.1 GNAT family N-acetyltransferase [Acaricomes phytoseiuli]